MPPISISSSSVCSNSSWSVEAIIDLVQLLVVLVLAALGWWWKLRKDRIRCRKEMQKNEGRAHSAPNDRPVLKDLGTTTLFNNDMRGHGNIARLREQPRALSSHSKSGPEVPTSDDMSKSDSASDYAASEKTVVDEKAVLSSMASTERKVENLAISCQL